MGCCGGKLPVEATSSQPGEKPAANPNANKPNPAPQPQERFATVHKNVPWTERYTKGAIIGEGGSCSVFQAKRHDGHLFAMKFMHRAGEKFSRALWQTEVGILQKFNHPYIVSLIEAYDNDKRSGDEKNAPGPELVMVMELVEGTDFFEAVISNVHFSEQEAARHVKTMIMAVQTLHAKGIVHGDIKPENFVFSSRDFKSDLKLIDFGCAIVFANDKDEQKITGMTLHYSSPELVQGERLRPRPLNELKAADMWALGVIVFILLFGRRPFDDLSPHPSNSVIVDAILNKKPPIPPNTTVSPPAIDLILKLLDKNMNQRLTAEDALKHAWIADAEKNPNQPFSKNLLENIGRLQNASKLKAAVASFVADHLSEAELKALSAAFAAADKDKSGALDMQEVEQLMANYLLAHKDGATPQLLKQESSRAAQNFVTTADIDADQEINPVEFRRMMQMAALSSDETLIRRTFQALDLNGDGTITPNELAAAFRPYFKNIDAVVQDLMKEADEDGDGTIDAKEFERAMLKGTNVRSEDTV